MFGHLLSAESCHKSYRLTKKRIVEGASGLCIMYLIIIYFMDCQCSIHIHGLRRLGITKL